MMEVPEFDLGSFGDIIGSLTEEDIERLTSLAGQFMGDTGQRQEPSKEETGAFGLDPEMLMRLMKAMNRLNSLQPDPRCNLIMALKPLLSPERRQKADTAVELLRLMNIFSLRDIFGME